MSKWTKEKLEAAGYILENAQITSVDLTMEDHGCFTLCMTIEWEACGCVYGGYSLGNGYLDADDDYFKGYKEGIEFIMKLMNVIGVSKFNSLKGKYVRVATKGLGYPIKIIGNIISDKWFDPEEIWEKDE